REPDKVNLVFPGGQLTAEESLEVVSRLANFLDGEGVHAGDVVSLVCANHPLHLLTYAACAWLGAIVNPINVRLSGAEVT
ncbi:AMP-binding protein, partial [Aerococcus urinae]|nr:AMP-binding protein [Aerococcus urinae]